MDNKVINGDSVEELKKFADNSIDLIITDPPYNLGYSKENFMIGDNCNILPLVLKEIYRILKPEGAVYIFLANKMLADWVLRLSMFFKMQNLIIWDKGAPTFQYGGANWGFSYEVIFFGIKSNKHKVRINPRDIIQIKNIMKGRNHPSEKPVELLEQFVKVSSDKGAIILDPFAGIGSTIIACINQERIGIGIEIENRYVQIANQRIEKALNQRKPFVKDESKDKLNEMENK